MVVINYVSLTYDSFLWPYELIMFGHATLPRQNDITASAEEYILKYLGIVQEDYHTCDLSSFLT